MIERVLFRVAAGPRVGYGHLVRARRLAAALGVRPLVSLDGATTARAIARRFGWRLVDTTPRALHRVGASVLVIDQPRDNATTSWIRAARDLGIPSVSIHDLGVAPTDADLTIDGSIAPGPATLSGPHYAIVDPHLRPLRSGSATRRTSPPTVLISLGGGPRRLLATRLARAIGRERDVQLDVIGGMRSRRTNQPTLADAFSRATVAVLGGGVTLYEACAAGVPAIGLAVVTAQQPTVRGLAEGGAVIDGGRAVPQAAARIARQVAALLDSPAEQRRLRRAGMQLVDGRGVERVAAAIHRLAATGGHR